MIISVERGLIHQVTSELVKHKEAVALVVGAGLLGAGIMAGWVIKENHEADVAIAGWADPIRNKLSGSHPLDKGEEIYNSATITPAGRTSEDALNQAKIYPYANVRAYPSGFLPNHMPTPQLGRIRIGDTIYGVVLETQGLKPTDIRDSATWYAFDCASAPVVWDDGKKKDEPQVCAVYGDYVKPEVTAKGQVTTPTPGSGFVPPK